MDGEPMSTLQQLAFGVQRGRLTAMAATKIQNRGPEEIHNFSTPRQKWELYVFVWEQLSFVFVDNLKCIL